MFSSDLMIRKLRQVYKQQQVSVGGDVPHVLMENRVAMVT